MNNLPSPDKIIAFLGEHAGAVSTADIKNKFGRAESYALMSMLRRMAENGDLVRIMRGDRVFYRTAPNASGLMSLPMWRIRIPAYDRSRVVSFEDRVPVRPMELWGA